MSRENVELTKRLVHAYNARDVEAMRELSDPGLVLDWSASRAWLAGVYRGIDEALRFHDGYYEAFELITLAPDRYIDAGDSVAVPNVAHQRGRDGIEVTARSTLVFTAHAGKITRICLFQEEAEALKSLGLEE